MNEHHVPDDFPRNVATAVVSGASPKVRVRLSNGVYCADETGEERRTRWLICDDLAAQLVPIAKKAANAHPRESVLQTLLRIRAAVKAKSWLSANELEWALRRLQKLLTE
ncbi:hypothetical protein SAMN05192563_10062 [Paraburkholderia aspalathi]|uniref:Uncharacterized protein n=1 Tax=Paraburkholderia aspalathi TaxID=1324617 RepID=A0A1I7C7Y7_9BURK|nr:hypothetical protein SAMN05192563_10062 [Paraburkholderia aspalathi]